MQFDLNKLVQYFSDAPKISVSDINLALFRLFPSLWRMEAAADEAARGRIELAPRPVFFLCVSCYYSIAP